MILLIKEKRKVQGVHDDEHKRKTATYHRKTKIKSILREKRNSMMEEQSKTPQHQDQAKRVR